MSHQTHTDKPLFSWIPSDRGFSCLIGPQYDVIVVRALAAAGAAVVQSRTLPAGGESCGSALLFLQPGGGGRRRKSPWGWNVCLFRSQSAAVITSSQLCAIRDLLDELAVKELYALRRNALMFYKMTTVKCFFDSTVVAGQWRPCQGPVS